VEAGFPIAAIGGGSGETAQRLASVSAAVVVTEPYADLGRLARLVIVTTPDHAFAEVTRMLRDHSGMLPGSAVLHTSATEPAARVDLDSPEVLALSLHPMRPFPDREGGAERFRGTVMGVEGADPARTLGHELVRLLGGRLVDLNADQKALYHIAGVMSANGAMALARAAEVIASRLGLGDGFVPEGVLPGMRAALEAVEEQGLPKGLTGPITRGDADVVARHLETLAEELPELAPIYREVARINLSMVEELGRVDAAAIDRLRRILDPPDGTG
jgi:predicted short-subunit dehydrogenase-like oxidoreductase (DUF2520 family)